MVFRYNQLEAEKNQQIFQETLKIFPEFRATSTRNGPTDHRRSLFYPEGDRIFPIADPLLQILPSAIKDLGVAAFTPTKVEHQITWHGGGDYYRMHLDNGTPDTATRKLSFCYYFCKEPREFTGGELAFKFWPEVVEPENNLLIIFPADWWHEVRPVESRHRNPRYGRFTLNGWIS